MNHLNFRQKSNERPNQALLATFEAYLQRNNINCTMADLEPLNYLWKDLQHRFYTKEAFVSEFVRNDYNVRQSTSKEEDLEAELARQGFRRNAWFCIFQSTDITDMLIMVYKLLRESCWPNVCSAEAFQVSRSSWYELLERRVHTRRIGLTPRRTLFRLRLPLPVKNVSRTSRRWKLWGGWKSVAIHSTKTERSEAFAIFMTVK